jgi:thioesterase domain-containing protein
VIGFRDLANALDPDQPVYGLQALGLDGLRDPLPRVEEMAAHYLQEIQTVQPAGPYLLAGLSFGGVVAWEMGLRLHAQGQRVALLALFDTPGPRYSKRYFVQRIPDHLRHFANLSGKGKLNYLLGRLWSYKNRIRAALRSRSYESYHKAGRNLPPRLRNVEIACKHAYKKYVPQSYSGKMTLFRAEHQQIGAYNDRLLGWGGLADEFEVHDMPGLHIEMIEKPNVHLLARKLAECIDQVRG